MKSITNCRVCGSGDLQEILNLGNQPLSGVFPSSRSESISIGPLRLVHCGQCKLVQLGETFNHEEMYGDNYGYRSGLNPTMVDHLSRIAQSLRIKSDLKQSDIVCDIGSNDSTFLNFFRGMGLTRVGIDPTISKLESFYDDDVITIPELFSSDAYFAKTHNKAKMVTSIAMFYDLESPVDFANEINAVLDENGYWFFEQSYAPWMQSTGAYDTICHEHLEYYSLTTICEVLKRTGFSVTEVSTNDTNGGSISVLAQKTSNAADFMRDEYGTWLLDLEMKSGANELRTWIEFGNKVKSRRRELQDLLQQIKLSGKTILGLGASTKGNVLLNFSDISSEILPMIGEVNSEKFQKITPGSFIPIVDEKMILEAKPDYILFLPWHFKNFALIKYADFLKNGGRFIFPLPNVEVVGY